MNKILIGKKPFRFVFQQPVSVIVSGPSKCGKTSLLISILSNPHYFKPAPSRVFWLQGIVNEGQMEMIRTSIPYEVIFLDDLSVLGNTTIPKNSIIVVDDMMQKINSSNEIADMFTKSSHHKNISVFCLTQNLFGQGRRSRDISLNSSHMIIFKNPRDSQQIQYLSRQVFPKQKNFLLKAYELATQRPHGYLLLDFSQQTPDNLRVLTNIYPAMYSCAFLPE